MIKFLKITIDAIKYYIDKKFKTTLSDWEENDETSLNFIKNRTHYDNRIITETKESISLSFGDYIYDKDYIIVRYGDTEDNTVLVKISDTPLTKEQLIGATIKKTFRYIDKVENITLTEDVLTDSNDYISYNDDEIFSILENDVYYKPLYGSAPGGYMSKGVWVKRDDEYYYSSIFNTFTKTHVEGELKKIDLKYLPNGIIQCGERQHLTDKQLSTLYSSMKLDSYVKNFKHNNMILIDQDTGYEYLIFMKDGTLTSVLNVLIQISSLPIKTDYTDTEEFDPTGMKLIAVYQDGSTKEINEYTYDKYVTTESYEHTICCVDNGIRYTANIPITTRTLEDALVDFEYIDNNNGTYTITGWKGTHNGLESTEMIIPNSPLITINIEETEWEEDE